MKGLTDIPGILVGHATDVKGLTGCTVVLCPDGAVAGYSIGGNATGTQELDVMSPLHVTSHVHAIVLAGGSAFGLEAAAGVRRWLEGQGKGFATGAAVVPIVPAAILYDLGIGDSKARPTREMGEVASASATSGPVAEGNIGAGTGATVGKFFGLAQAMKSGLGSATVELGAAFPGVKVAALAAVNAYGDVLDPATGRILAGARLSPQAREFAGMARLVKEKGPQGGLQRSNTTLVVVATNARLTKPQCTQLADRAQHGLVRTISPVHTLVDGDIVFALSSGDLQAPIDSLGIAAAEAVATAIVRAVRAASTAGGVPGLAG
jgi:L-aminopeptidase/D-esterase-like protein